MFTAPFITAAHPSYAVVDTILPRDAQWRPPVFSHTRSKHPGPRTCRLAVRRPVNFIRLSHFLIHDIDQISGLARPPANFWSKKNPTCPSHSLMTFPHLVTIFGSKSQGVNIKRGYFVTFCDGRIENEVKSEFFLHPQFTFYPLTNVR